MKIDLTTPSAEFLLLAFNGEVVGCVLEADTEAGYIIQRLYDPATDTVGEPVRREGRVDLLGNTETDSSETLQERFNTHRSHLGLPPYES